MFPCRTCSASASDQVTQAVNYLKQNSVEFGTFWFDIEGPGTYWPSDTASNADWMAEAIQTANNLGVTIGIYTSASQWVPIMGDWTGGSPYPLWYAHYDNDPSFSDFSPFNGWTKPAIKQYQGTTSVCGASVDLDWYP